MDPPIGAEKRDFLYKYLSVQEKPPSFHILRLFRLCDVRSSTRLVNYMLVNTQVSIYRSFFFALASVGEV